MLRSLVLVGALFVSAPALACGGSTGTAKASTSGTETAASTEATAASTAKTQCKMSDYQASVAAAESVATANGTRVALTVTGMHCGSCADKVATALQGVEGVKAAAVDIATGKAEIVYDSAKVNQARLLTAVSELGYGVKVADS